MAIVRPMDEEGFRQWLRERPPEIQAMIKRHPPDRLYRMKVTGHRCTIESYSENGTVTVNVTGTYNRIIFSRQVFGVSPDSLEECDLPAPGENVGDTAAEAGYTEEDVRNILIPKMIADRQSKESSRA